MITRIDEFRMMVNESTTLVRVGDIVIRKHRSFRTDEGTFSEYDIESGEWKNMAELFVVLESKDGWIVRNVWVPEPLQRTGIATAAYIKLNELSLENTGKPLRSTRGRTLNNGTKVHEITSDGINLWDSLVAKGYAVKNGYKDYVFKEV